MLTIQNLIDDAKCYQTVRELRWPTGVICTKCASAEVIKQGREHTQPFRQKYLCQQCSRHFDDLTEAIFAGHLVNRYVLLSYLCRYFMGLNLSNQQMAQELQ